MQKDSQERGTVVGRQREEIYNGKMGDNGLESRVGRECSISRGGGADSTVEVYVSEESEEGGVTVLRQGGSSNSESCQEL